LDAACVARPVFDGCINKPGIAGLFLVLGKAARIFRKKYSLFF
jgi:hypothetical protein